MALPGYSTCESQNTVGHTGRLSQIDVILLFRNRVNVCNGNNTAIPVHVSALNCNFIATIVLITITHVIICVT